MINLFLQNLNINTFTIFLLILLILLDFLLLIKIKKNRNNDILCKFDEMYSKIKNDINFAVVPKSINLTQDTDDFIQFAIEIWRIEQKIEKLKSSLSENQKKSLENSTQKLKRYFDKHDFEIVDYTGQKFNEGLNLDVLSFEKNLKIKEPIIKETVEPTIMFKGQVVRKAKIVVLTR